MESSGFDFLCGGCTQYWQKQITCLEMGRFTVDAKARAEMAIPREVPDGALGLRLLCPECRKQSFAFPTTKHYTCAKCKYEHETYVQGDTAETPRGAISFSDSDGAQKQANSILQALRNGSLNSGGGW